jgi:hypothetical protein
MSGATLVVFVGILGAVLLITVALMVWQEGKKRSFDLAPSYVIDDLIAHVRTNLDPEILGRIGTDGVERIIDWEVRYLLRDGGEGVIAGGTDASVSYIVDRIDQVHRVSYSQDDVRAVLALEAEYLMAVGAIGDPVSPEGDGEA